jgi:hypothetical protein
MVGEWLAIQFASIEIIEYWIANVSLYSKECSVVEAF